MENYYSTDISITINEIKASSRQEADALIAEFIAKIAPIMSDKIHWDEADWHVEEEGTCDTCEGSYDLSNNTTRCGDCGNCGECCTHVCEICEENPRENVGGKWCTSCKDDNKGSESR